MANRLEHETSPYLLQHKDNPVDWWPWGPEALAAARASGKPILLSVGYAACHWCHVMAHESFEDPATAAVMNDLFVNIKVDREERPDIDAIYMKALHSLGEHGGWPLTMFLTPDASPFWGGTYFPPEDRYGRPSFRRVLAEIARLHRQEPERIEGNAAAILERLREPPAGGGGQIREDGIRDLALRLAAAVDPVDGGLRGAPKFPQFSIFWLLWRCGLRFGLRECLEATHTTLTRICQGGIYDHLGGGFARYSVDERWLVPHFEKMLYDNALLVRLMTEVWLERQDPLLARRVEETVAWLAREMRTPEGAFAASYDADSEGEEGRYYVWTPAEVEAVLGSREAEVFCRHYDITAEGNFEGHGIPNRLHERQPPDAATERHLSDLRQRLLAARSARVPPGWDDKVLADWNGLAIEALALASRAFGRPDWLALARGAFELVRTAMTVDGRLVHSRRLGRSRGPATAADHANMIAAALALHQVEGRPSDLAAARDWAEVMHRHYWSPTGGGYCLTADDTPDVIVRSPVGSDDATPNANGVMVTGLVHLHLLTGEAVYRERAEATLAAFMGEVAAAPAGHTGLLAGALDLLSPQHVVLLGPAADRLARVIGELSLPGAVVQILPDGAPPAPPGSPLHGKGPVGGRATAYVCAGMVCSAPMAEPPDLREALLAARARPSG